MSATTDQETFRAIMKIVGLSEPTINAIQLGRRRTTLDKYNLHEHPGGLHDLKTVVSISDKEFELLNMFRDYYSELPPSRRAHILAHFDSTTWLDYKESYRSRQLKTQQSRLKAGFAILLFLVVVLVPTVFLQWKSLGVSQALLELECRANGNKKIPVNCRRVDCSCCYQRERTSRDTKWYASSDRCGS